MMDLDDAVRGQDLKPTQIRDLTNKMLDDTQRLYFASNTAAQPAAATDAGGAGETNKNPSEDNTNTGSNTNAATNVVDSNGNPSQADSAQGGTGDASRDASGKNGDKSNDSEMVLAKDFGGLGGANNVFADLDIQSTAKKYGVNLSYKAADALREEMNDEQAKKLRSDKISDEDKLNIMLDIEKKVLQNSNVKEDVKSNLQKADEDIEKRLKK